MPQINSWYKRGLKDGIPIALGYFAVSFALGIAAKNAGLTPLQATISSLLTNASAGEYAGFELIAAGAPLIELIIMEIIVNARYLLMSCALSQKLSPDTSIWHRLLIGFDVTDEIFAISVTVPGTLNPLYTYGAMSVSIPGWAAGTCLGVVLGNLLPVSIVNALSVGLFGMFIAIIIPPARKNKIIAFLVFIGMALSFAFAKLPYLCKISQGFRIIILTVVISLVAAILFPIKDEEEQENAN
ncbi:MAG: AzlC family ABC transporter permease [Clostridia bacterium]|nr:AzlC family ABC transporter permease [Clostridia bacterium]